MMARPATGRPFRPGNRASPPMTRSRDGKFVAKAPVPTDPAVIELVRQAGQRPPCPAWCDAAQVSGNGFTLSGEYDPASAALDALPVEDDLKLWMIAVTVVGLIVLAIAAAVEWMP